MSLRRSFVFVSLLGSLALAGFGCKKADTLPFVSGNASPNARVILPTLSINTKSPEQPTKRRVTSPERLPDPNVLRARDAMIGFNKSQSFRASITIGGKEGIKGDVSFSHPNGMFGTLTLGNGMKADIALRETRVAVRSNTSTWQEVTDTPEAAQVIELFKAISNRTGENPAYPNPRAKFVSVTDDTVRGCRMYVVSEFMGDRGYQPVQICIKAELPVYFSIPSEDGLIEINYKDIDQPVTVFFPIP